MKNSKKWIIYILTLIMGLIIIALSAGGKTDSALWSGFGAGLTAVSIAKLIQIYKYRTDKEYREKVDIDARDERHRLLRMKAWSIAGYGFVLLASAATIVCMLTGKTDIINVLTTSICVIILIYLISYIILQKKE